MRTRLPGMGSVDLAAGESVTYLARPHWRTLLRPVLFALVLTGAVFFALGVLQHLAVALPVEPLIPILLVLYAIVLVTNVVVPFVQWRRTRFLVTTEHIITSGGGRGAPQHSIHGSHIHSLVIRPRGLDRLAGSTQVVISGLEGRFVYAAVPRREELSAALEQLRYAPPLHRR